MDLVFGPTSLHFSLLSAEKAKSQCKQFHCLSIRLDAPACHEICQRCTVMISIWVSVCITVIKTFNVYVDLDP